jgi:release factor glutamine methyltransferase
MTIAEALADAAARLAGSGVFEPRRESASLLSFALGRPHSFLIAHPEYILSDDEAAKFASAVERRERREPFQYITGKQEFWGLEFDVEPGVLIPRPETEILVEAAVEFLKTCWTPRFAEAGVGSGCISVSILYSVPAATAYATDVNPLALDLAGRNAAKHYVDARLTLRETDLLEGLVGPFDLVVSNPPYIPDAEVATLQSEVRDFEPHTALAGGDDGLDIVRRIVADARHIIRPGGVLMLEIGDGQAAAVSDLFAPADWAGPDFRKDLQGIDRVVSACRR